MRDDLDRFLAGDPPLALRDRKGGRAVTLLVLIAVALAAGAVSWVARPPAETNEETYAPPRLGPTTVAVAQGRVSVTGVVRTKAPWAEVRLLDARQRVAAGQSFTLSADVAPNTSSALLEVSGPGGEGRPRTVSLLSAWPGWFRTLSEGLRPPLPLPEGLRVADESLTYVWERDRSALVWVSAGEFTMGHSPKTVSERAWGSATTSRTARAQRVFACA